MQDDGGCIYLEWDGCSGTTGTPICDGGTFHGSIVESNEKYFIVAIQKWMASFLWDKEEQKPADPYFLNEDLDDQRYRARRRQGV